ncbi:MAG: hypothetical protein MZV63_53185 [Marinilabiliales bacterium]|nr:hypothetical protein [Marinilabiliales bacterium]
MLADQSVILYFLIGNLFTANGKTLSAQHRRAWAEAQFQRGHSYAYGYFKGEKAPFPVGGDRKFNPLQQVSYVGVMYFVVPLRCSVPPAGP